MPLPNFLNTKQQVKLPTGGDFVSTGMIGKWIGAVMHTFMSQTDMSIFQGFECDSRRELGDWHRYYFHDYHQAIQWNNEVGNRYNPQTAWVMQASSANLLNLSQEGRDVFGPHVTYDHCRVVTLRSKKYRHELHQIALPCAVAAYAQAAGWENAGFEVSELVDPDAIFDDDFYLQMVGDAESGAYEDSVLWKRRMRLWASLGEENPRVYQPMGTGSKFDATSDRLSEALGILACTWVSEIWCRLLIVPDPRPDAVYGDEGKRLGIACVTEIYDDQAAAQAAADVELAKRDVAKPGSSPASGACPSSVTTTAEVPVTTPVENSAMAAPSVPVAWADYPDNWKAEVGRIKSKYPGPLPLFAEQVQTAEAAGALESEHGCTAQDAINWWGLV